MQNLIAIRVRNIYSGDRDMQHLPLPRVSVRNMDGRVHRPSPALRATVPGVRVALYPWDLGNVSPSQTVPLPAVKTPSSVSSRWKLCTQPIFDIFGRFCPLQPPYPPPLAPPTCHGLALARRSVAAALSEAHSRCTADPPSASFNVSREANFGQITLHQKQTISWPSNFICKTLQLINLVSIKITKVYLNVTDKDRFM